MALVALTERKLQQLVAELNSAVNTATEVAWSSSNDQTFQ